MNNISTLPPRKACIRLPKTGPFVDWLVQHWREEGIDVAQPETGVVLLALAEVGTVELRQVSNRQLDCVLEPVASRMGELMQLSLSEHISQFADEQAWPEGSWELVWEGSRPRAAAGLQVMRVVSNQVLSPSMRRIRLEAGDLSAFVQGGLHVRMLLPVLGQQPEWPVLLDDGRLQWPLDKPRLARRTYTISAINFEETWLEVDALLHHSPASSDLQTSAPGATWAAGVQPGSEVGVLSPAGGLLPQAAHCVLVADACALPAAARIVNAQPAGSTLQLLLWVTNAQEQAALAPQFAGMHVTWLHGGFPGASQLEIAQVLQWLALQEWQRPDTALWVAGGLPLAQAVRRWVSGQPSLASLRSMIHTYWR